MVFGKVASCLAFQYFFYMNEFDKKELDKNFTFISQEKSFSFWILMHCKLELQPEPYLVWISCRSRKISARNKTNRWERVEAECQQQSIMHEMQQTEYIADAERAFSAQLCCTRIKIFNKVEKENTWKVEWKSLQKLQQMLGGVLRMTSCRLKTLKNLA